MVHRPVEDKVFIIISMETRLKQLGYTGELTDFECLLIDEFKRTRGNLYHMSRTKDIRLPVHVLKRVLERIFNKVELLYRIEAYRND